MKIKQGLSIAVCSVLLSTAWNSNAIQKAYAETWDWNLTAHPHGPRADAYGAQTAPVYAPRSWRNERRAWRHYHSSRPRRAWDENIRGYRQFTDVDDEISWRERRGELRGVACVGDRVTGLGTQWIGKQGALDAAKKDWMEHVRYYYGETFLDLDYSAGFKARCSRVSIGEVAGQVTYRCEMRARPCRAEMLDGEETVKK